MAHAVCDSQSMLSAGHEKEAGPSRGRRAQEPQAALSPQEEQRQRGCDGAAQPTPAVHCSRGLHRPGRNLQGGSLNMPAELKRMVPGAARPAGLLLSSLRVRLELMSLHIYCVYKLWPPA